MIRITGGEWKGRKIKTPAGMATRPTSSRVRESLFDVLGDLVSEREFYDLYAGCGAVGLEALSRGAPRATFVESAYHPLECLRWNIRSLGCRDRALCLPHKLPAWLRSPEFAPSPPVILFVDPPYQDDLAATLLEALALVETPTGWCGSLCAAQTERSARLDETYGPWHLVKKYPHGDTALWLFVAGDEEIPEGETSDAETVKDPATC